MIRSIDQQYYIYIYIILQYIVLCYVILYYIMYVISKSADTHVMPTCKKDIHACNRNVVYVLSVMFVMHDMWCNAFQCDMMTWSYVMRCNVTCVCTYVYINILLTYIVPKYIAFWLSKKTHNSCYHMLPYQIIGKRIFSTLCDYPLVI